MDVVIIYHKGFSALQRAEIAEICRVPSAQRDTPRRFSALQRAEIAEIVPVVERATLIAAVSVLFNEPKLLKSKKRRVPGIIRMSFSALQRAEIAEMRRLVEALRYEDAVSVLFNEPKLLKSFANSDERGIAGAFQCSSTSRNC